MRIAFICSSLNPGRDGVGDYTRRLATELQKQGHECLCIALNEKPGGLLRSDEVLTDDQSCMVMRCAVDSSWMARTSRVSDEIGRFRPDWISLQYVAWGYDPRGLTLGLANRLRSITESFPVHIMCHELWMEGKLFPPRHRLLGALQKPFFRRLFAVLRPQVVHTQIPIYLDRLRSMGVACGLFPLHGNIPVLSSKEEGRAWLAERTGRPEKEIRLGFFGAMHPSLSSDLLRSVLLEHTTQGAKVSILSGGSLGPAGVAVWERLKLILADKASFLALGQLEEHEVSRYLSGLDFGLTTYPSEFVGKSGSVATMLEHGLTVRLLGISASNGHSPTIQSLEPDKGCSVSEAAQRLVGCLSRGVV